ncbi:MAG: acylphosphatase [Chloroflexota bacterium]|jgi:acylphosphatase
MSSVGTRLVAVVRGYVQGVGFRWFVEREAARLGLAGWVANRADGSVEVVAEGPDERLGQLVLLLREGPSGSSVSEVEVRHEPARGNILGFTIRSAAHRGD